MKMEVKPCAGVQKAWASYSPADSTIILWDGPGNAAAIGYIEGVAPVVRCKDCKHRPKHVGEDNSGFAIEFPDHICPCQCEDGWYNWIPKDDWFCADGERKDGKRDDD